MSVPLEPDAAALRAMTDAVSRFVVEHVASLPQQPSFDLDGAEFVKKGLVGALPEQGRPLAEILDRLAPASRSRSTPPAPATWRSFRAAACTRRRSPTSSRAR
jgi:hypothetical protein